jgi:hypothetical protein
VTRRSRLLGAFAALLVLAGLTAVAAPGAGAAPSYTLVQPGGTVLLSGGGVTGTVMVDPPTAGTTAVLFGSLSFTAATGYEGPVTVQTFGQTFQLYVAAQDATATAQGSFTIVPVPGPCLLLVGDATVDFGELRPGGDWAAAPTGPNLLGCGEADAVHDVLVQATNAESETGANLSVDSCFADLYATCTPAMGSFAVGVPSVPLVLRSTPAVLYDDLSGAFTQRAVDLAVRMPSELAPSLMEDPFTFDVIFTATAG